jgi:hypothetical protein
MIKRGVRISWESDDVSSSGDQIRFPFPRGQRPEENALVPPGVDKPKE